MYTKVFSRAWILKKVIAGHLIVKTFNINTTVKYLKELSRGKYLLQKHYFVGKIVVLKLKTTN